MELRRYFPLFMLILLASCYPRGISQTAIYEETATNLPNSTVTPNNAYSYIGLKHPPFPNSIRTSTSWQAVISPSSSQSWSIEAVADGDNLMLWFSKLLHHDQNGNAFSQISDIAILPSTAKEQNIVVSSCLLEGLLDPEIVALVQLDEESLENRYLANPNIVLAWRANQSTGKLEQISTANIECYAETFLKFP